ncbi:hypothetical protein CROQUDRAFT_660437 [Cronartium quercuum f. sp. fusiforme G11]|uniref:Chromatin modification-related protein n=1 Tax=Cronartium quercuum f. sp. fusiforme G11 TaxID=708437 RepID=A0A9P6NHE8_9BASI|nr:hypothetical protein CROQUDRAFT_660437 [Cronartium quercuum f. sp. fusiforme G11]
MEDATHTLLQDFVDSLSNLPSEVGHLLCEIAYLDYAKQPTCDDPPPVSQAGNGESGSKSKWYSVEESRRKAASKQHSIVRHSHKPPNNLLTENPKEPLLISRALAHYDDAIKLSLEKEKFASRAVGLVSRHLNRLNHELAKLEQLTGVEVPEFKREPSEVPGSMSGLDFGLMQSMAGQSTSNAADQPTPGLEGTRQKRKHHAAETPTPLPVHSPLTEVTPSALTGNPKRRMTNSRSVIKLSVTPAPVEAPVEEEVPEDEASLLDDSNAGDDTLYCFCQRGSFGKMIGCDNKHCRYEWFHVPCLGMKETPTGKWFCPECTNEDPKLGKTAQGRGRKRS